MQVRNMKMSCTSDCKNIYQKTQTWPFFITKTFSRYTSRSNLAKYSRRTWMKDVPKEPPRKLQKSCVQLNFREHCLYFGEICDLSKDPKHPDRWRPDFLRRSTYFKHDKKKLHKDFLLENVEYAMMNGSVWSGYGWRGPWICMLQMPYITGTVCASSWPSETSNQQKENQKLMWLIQNCMEAFFRFMLENKNSL